MAVDEITGEGLAFSFVLYVTPCGGGIGRVVDTKRSLQERVDAYAPGLLKNAAFVDAEFSRASLILHIPREELEIECVSRLVHAMQEFQCVRIQPFLREDVAADVWCWDVEAESETKADAETNAETNAETKSPSKKSPVITADWTLPGAPMPTGQKLRCARYLPLYTSDAETTDKTPKYDEWSAIVVRDADSIMTRTDATLVRRWLASGASCLVYQEHKMTRSLAMGGGFACRPSLLNAAHAVSLRHAILHLRVGNAVDKMNDEGLLSELLPRTVATVRVWRDAVREAPAQTPRADAFMHVCTRMTRGGSYFVWNPRTQTCGELLWPHIREDGMWTRKNKPQDKDWIR